MKYSSGRLRTVIVINHIKPKINIKLIRCTKNKGISGSSDHII